MNFSCEIANFTKLFNKKLEKYFEENFDDTKVYSALRYSVENGGKRLRPYLAYKTFDLFNNLNFATDHFLFALEFIHCYSLVHDDLPGLDNDIIRRGKATTHVKFGEGQAILAGDALLNLSIEELIKIENRPNKDKAIAYVYLESGMRGMLKGQSQDINKDDIKTLEDILNLYRYKTSCLFKSAIVASAIYSNATIEEIEILEQIADYLGIIYQLVDDRLGVTSDVNILGKSINKDIELDKMTVINKFGIEKADELIKIYKEKIEKLIANNGKFVFYKNVLDFAINRIN